MGAPQCSAKPSLSNQGCTTLNSSHDAASSSARSCGSYKDTCSLPTAWCTGLSSRWAGPAAPRRRPRPSARPAGSAPSASGQPKARASASSCGAFSVNSSPSLSRTGPLHCAVNAARCGRRRPRKASRPASDKGAAKGTMRCMALDYPGSCCGPCQTLPRVSVVTELAGGLERRHPGAELSARSHSRLRVRPMASVQSALVRTPADFYIAPRVVGTCER